MASLDPSEFSKLPLFDVVAYKETADTHLEIGVFKGGVPFMTGRSLARAAGIAGSTISELFAAYADGGESARNKKLKELFDAHGFSGSYFGFPATINGRASLAYPGPVCMAILEYYSFHAGQNCKAEAAASFRLLGQKGFQTFVYEATGYGRDDRLSAYFDRVALNNVIPTGFFSIFKESDEIIVALIAGGLPADQTTVPDISLGQHWSRHWKSAELEKIHGAPSRFPHNYPSTYPQSAANVEALIYPDGALPEYRRWVREVYIPSKLQPYLTGKIAKKQLSSAQVDQIMAAVSPLSLQAPQRRPELGPGA
jgi:hypothetical protein